MLKCVYLIWQGDTPDKGILFEDIFLFDAARERLRNAQVAFRSAVVPRLPLEVAQAEVNRLIGAGEATS